MTVWNWRMNARPHSIHLTREMAALQAQLDEAQRAVADRDTQHTDLQSRFESTAHVA